MKALTLYQPWASLLVAGVKLIETRQWRTAYRGLLAIHAGQNRRAGRILLDPYSAMLGRSQGQVPAVVERAIQAGLPAALEDYPFGVVVGTVVLVDIRPTEAVHRAANPLGPLELVLGDYTPGRYAWICREPLRYPVPIPARGERMLWDWTAAPTEGR